MPRIMSAHQPNFLPYLGFFDKMLASDVFVIRDEVQFTERDWHHRNQIRIQGTDNKGNPKSKWITVPVIKEPEYLNDISIRTDTEIKKVPWHRFMLRQIRSNYERADHFGEYFQLLDDILSANMPKLIDLNMEIIRSLAQSFGIKTEIVTASELKGYQKSYEPNEDLVRIAKATSADVYLSGSGGKTYLDREVFEKNGIEVRFQDFHHPTYLQQFPGFLPNMASIDALFNVGRTILRPEPGRTENDRYEGRTLIIP